MIAHLFFFFFAIVSKSLLTVWGTLSLPAFVDRGKCRWAGIEHSRPAWKTPTSTEFPTLPTVLLLRRRVCPLSWLMASLPRRRRACPAMPCTPCLPVIRAFFYAASFAKD